MVVVEQQQESRERASERDDLGWRGDMRGEREQERVEAERKEGDLRAGNGERWR